jgi:hypothetical protein
MSRLSLTLVFVLALPQLACAIVTSDEAGSHVVTPGQPAFGVNLDGVVLIGRRLPNVNTISRLTPRCSAAVISDRHLLCAAHCFDENEDGAVDDIYTAIPHTAAFELADGTFLIDIDATTIQLAPNWPQEKADIAVLTLTDVAPAPAPRYALYGGAGELGQPVIMTGYGTPGHGSTGSMISFVRPPPKRAGLNRVDDIRDDLPGGEFLVVDFDSGQETHNTLTLSGIESDLGFGADEVFSALGDSGGPMFVGQAIAGINSFSTNLDEIDPVNNSSWGEIFHATRVRYFRDFLTMATNGSAVFVPEPGGGLLVLIASMIGSIHRRRWIDRNITNWQTNARRGAEITARQSRNQVARTFSPYITD